MFMAIPPFSLTTMTDRRRTKDRRVAAREAQDLVQALSRDHGYVEFSPDGRIITANIRFLDLLSYTLEELRGQHHGILIDAASRQSADYRAFWERLLRGKSERGEYRFATKDGRALWVQGCYNTLLDDAGKTYKVIAHVTDVTNVKLLESARITGLHMLTTGVMIADNQLNIRYLNPAATTLMHGAEPDLRKELPAFSVAGLIGANIDVFHKNPSHQRKLLSVLDKPHPMTITIGTRTFDLIVSPLLDHAQRIGFAVEWSDAKERLLSLDYVAYFSAISASQAVIEFTSDGRIVTANPNFLKVVGYGIDEIRGQHHSLFVDPGYRQTNDYRMFWEKLGRGEYDSGQYKRIAKGGGRCGCRQATTRFSIQMVEQ